jgi:hypothetical protein
MIGKKSRAKGQYDPYQNNMSAGYVAGGDGLDSGTNFQPPADGVQNLVNPAPMAPKVKGDESSCSGTCEVSWKPARKPGN